VAQVYEGPPEELRYDWREGVGQESPQVSLSLRAGQARLSLRAQGHDK